MIQKPISEGRVDRRSQYFELCHGNGDDSPSSWTVVALIGGDDGDPPILEFVLDASHSDAEQLRAAARRQLEEAIYGRDISIVMFVDSDGQHRLSWRGTLGRRCGATYNWYGDWHFRPGSR